MVWTNSKSRTGLSIWCNSGFTLKVQGGQIEIITSKDEPKLVHAGGALKEAFLAPIVLDRMKRYFERNFDKSKCLVYNYIKRIERW